MLNSRVQVYGERRPDQENRNESDDSDSAEELTETASELTGSRRRVRTTGNRATSTRSTRRVPVVEEWRKKRTTTSKDHGVFPPKNITAYQDLTPTELFILFFTPELIKDIVAETNFHARKKNNIDLRVTESEMYTLLSILILSGYNSVPRYEMYWESGPDIGNSAVQQAIRRNRFRDTKLFSR